MIYKRILDFTFLVLMAVPAMVCVLMSGVLILVSDRGPVFFRAARVGQAGCQFTLWKLRTMRETGANGHVFSGADGARVIPLARRLRSARVDELPQMWNIFRGQMHLVGPRPVSPCQVGMAAKAYQPLLQQAPGLTGLATVMLCGREERILSRCLTRKRAEAAFEHRCLPVKLRIENLYARKGGVRLDLYVLYLTLARFVPLPGRRAQRLWRDAAWTRALRGVSGQELATYRDGMQALSA